VRSREGLTPGDDLLRSRRASRERWWATPRGSVRLTRRPRPSKAEAQSLRGQPFSKESHRRKHGATLVCSALRTPDSCSCREACEPANQVGDVGRVVDVVVGSSSRSLSGPLLASNSAPVVDRPVDEGGVGGDLQAVDSLWERPSRGPTALPRALSAPSRVHVRSRPCAAEQRSVPCASACRVGGPQQLPELEEAFRAPRSPS